MISKLFNINAIYEDEEDILLFWKKIIFKHLFTVILILAIIPYFLSCKLAVSLSNWHWVLIYSLFYAWGGTVTFIEKIPFSIRVWGGIAIFYGMGVFSLWMSGPVGSGQLYLLCFSAFAAIFSNIKGSLFALGLNIITFLIFGYLNTTGVLQPKEGGVIYDSSQWMIVSASFSFICATITLSLAIFLKTVEISGKKFKHLVKNTSDILWTADKNLKITYINNVVTSLLGYQVSEVIGCSLESFIYEPENTGVGNQLAQEEQYSGQVLLLHKEGLPIYVKLSGSKISSASGNRNYYQGLIRDITKEISREKEKIRLEEKLAQSKKLEALGILAGSVAHDLNNILSGIATYPEVMMMDKTLNPKIRQGLSMIKDSGQKASAVVSDLLTISRGSSAVKEILNLNTILERYETAHDFEIIKQNYEQVKIEIITEAELLNTKGSYIHLEKIIMNLVLNAVEEVSKKEGGKVLVTTANSYIDPSIPGYNSVEQGEYVILRVMDNGSGIDAENIKNIFDPFYTKKEMGKSGTGLGLTVVWNAVQDHDGHIFVSSDKQGTRFELLFPAIRQEIQTNQDISSIDEISGQGQMILIVDDLKDQQEIAMTIVKTLGYQAKAVDNGYDAVEYIKNNPVDLVILDMIMAPSISGLETYRLIKKVNPGQKAIIASGYPESQDVSMTQDLGAGSFVKKPYTILDMGIAIKEELEK